MLQLLYHEVKLLDQLVAVLCALVFSVLLVHLPELTLEELHLRALVRFAHVNDSVQIVFDENHFVFKGPQVPHVLLELVVDESALQEHQKDDSQHYRDVEDGEGIQNQGEVVAQETEVV